jgi:hypothetical protein
MAATLGLDHAASDTRSRNQVNQRAASWIGSVERSATRWSRAW